MDNVGAISVPIVLTVCAVICALVLADARSVPSLIAAGGGSCVAVLVAIVLDDRG